MVVDRCAHHAAELLALSGARGIFEDLPLARHVQDISAGRSHYANNPDLFSRNFGRVLLGYDNNDLFI